MEQVLYFIGDTYSREILPYLQKRFATNFSFHPFHSQESLTAHYKCLVYSPTIDRRELPLIVQAHEAGIAVVMLLDHGHLSSQDYLHAPKPNLVIHPGAEDILGCRNVCNLSVYQHFIRSSVEKDPRALAQNSQKLVFCSQPLWEDQRGVDQYDLLRQLQKKASDLGLELVNQRHPREVRAVPSDLASIETLSTSIHESLGLYPKWIGYDSMPLFGARALNHQVVFLKYDSISDIIL